MDPWLQIHGQQVDPLPEDSVDSDWWIRLRFGVVEFFFSSPSLNFYRRLKTLLLKVGG